MRSDHEVQVGGLGECVEVAVARNERNPAIDATLGDQNVAQARFQALAQNLSSQRAGSFPITGREFDQGYF